MTYSELGSALARYQTAHLVSPLRTWRAWDHGPDRTSQRRSLQLLQYCRNLAIFGGNRTGKTEGLRAASVAILSGADHPDCADFWDNNGCDPGLFPTGPDTGWMIAVTSSDSLRYHRQQTLDMIPKWGPAHERSRDGHNWFAWNLMGRGEARIEWMVPGYDKPAAIVFKSEDQGIRSFQGDAVRLALHDEEGKTIKVLEQTKYRLIDKDGYHLFADTPIHGRTWVYHKFEGSKADKDWRVARIWTQDNPYLPPHRIRDIVNDPVRGKGLFVVMEGKIWPFTRETHVVPPFTIPPDLRRFRSIDFGTRHPFACNWACVLRKPIALSDGRVLPEKSMVIYREHYLSEKPLMFHAERIYEAEGYVRKPGALATTGFRAQWDATGAETIEATWADPEDAQALMQLNNTYGIPAMSAKKGRTTGFKLVEDWMTPDHITGMPRIYVFDTCPETIRELEDYRWQTVTTAEGVEKEVPSEVSDHTCDNLRYLTMGVNVYYGG